MACRTVRRCAADPVAAALVDSMYTPTDKAFLANFAEAAAHVHTVLQASSTGGPPRLDSLCELLARLQCNNFAIHDNLLQARGSGVYPAGAVLNHDCNGNCVM